MNKFLRVMLIIVMILMVSAAFLQIFFPQFMGSHSEYGVAVGWQREIAFWNLAIIPFIVAVFLRYDWYYLQVLLLSLSLGGFYFGTNHLLGYLSDSTKIISLVGALENYGLVLCWFIGWRIEKRSIKI
ncbi:hypothetical protein AOC36_00600 [Erysipelothrix larvae]|uniref:DUF4345 domain-containing protein n=2 Tax=Erysipelothrix larvae TaxID=1514105 RepID=A0A109UHR2_9FIRM|nr:hypothetical protein AOC36_00600 [Erysipelothrix larvae]